MGDFKNIVLIIIAIIGAVITVYSLCKIYQKRSDFNKRNFIHGTYVTFITDFFDNIGIGCFAPQTIFMKTMNITSLKNIPGTLNVGYIGTAIAESFLSLTIIKVDFITFISNVVAAIVGSFAASYFYKYFNEKVIQKVIGYGLLIAALTIALRLFGLLPESSNVEMFRGFTLAITIIASFLIGMGVVFGVGNFAPTLAVFALLGFNPKAVFPIMMVAAFGTSIASTINFVKDEEFDPAFSLAGLIFGTLGVLLSALIVFNLPAEIFRTITLIVIVIAALTILLSKVDKKAKKNS